MSEAPPAGQPADPRARYFERVERHFGIRRGGPVMLSPRDWQLLDGWYEQGIPLRVVLQGINRAFDRFAAESTARRINSLSYCSQPVEEIWEEDRELSAADGGDRRDAGSPGAGHLRQCAASCRELATAETGVDEALVEAAAALEALADGDLSIARIDAEATAIEQRLRARLERADRRIRIPRFSPWGV